MQLSFEDNLSAQDNRRIYAVAEITRLIKTTLENEFGNIWIEGEISNLRKPSSGHLYFTLKDETSQMRAVLFRGARTSLEIRDGMKVRAYGQITVYERSGDYQVIVRKIEDAGKGQLQAAFEALKKKLSEEGLFDAARKKPIPILPQHVGVVTSPTGAAIRDILNVVSRRFPNLHILIAPVKVQGEGAAEQIARAIDFLNERGGIDVMIVGRGGGSLEDLWCFNEEVVARAIARSKIPVISAVGHEIDFTISDFVADMRAPTPSAAAELVVGQKEAFEEHVKEMARRLERGLKASWLEWKNRLTAAARSYVFREPQNLVQQFVQRIESYRMRMSHELTQVVQVRQQQLDELNMKMSYRMETRRQVLAQDLKRLSAQLTALSPLAVLDRGFSITWRENGEILRRLDGVEIGEQLQTQVSNGMIKSRVTERTEVKDHGGKEDGRND
jgi:exodeoxyribonuclease VII large subunit